MDFCASYFGIQGQDMKKHDRTWRKYKQWEREHKGIVEVEVLTEKEKKLRLKWKLAIQSAIEKMIKEPEKNWMFHKKMFNGKTIDIFHENNKNYIRCTFVDGTSELFEVNRGIDILKVIDTFELREYYIHYR